MLRNVERLLKEANPMVGVFQNIDPSLPGECAGGRWTHSLVGDRGGGSIFWKTSESDTALYSTYGSLCRITTFVGTPHTVRVHGYLLYIFSFFPFFIVFIILLLVVITSWIQTCECN